MTQGRMLIEFFVGVFGSALNLAWMTYGFSSTISSVLIDYFPSAGSLTRSSAFSKASAMTFTPGESSAKTFNEIYTGTGIRLVKLNQMTYSSSAFRNSSDRVCR